MIHVDAMHRSAKTHTPRKPAAWRDVPRGSIAGVTLLAASVGGIFGTALVTDQIFVFRDAAHFYYPLFQWTANQWMHGLLPLWNSLEDLGVPVIADATSSVFYPGKLLLLMPGPFGFWFKVYVVAHAFLCGWTSFCLARHWQVRRSAATLAALSYALSGSVLFQYCNVVYLVGAAWLPAAIQAGDQLLTQGGARNMVSLAFCLAMIVLGGDAQTAYHTGLMLVALAWMSWPLRKQSAVRTVTKQTVKLVLAASLAMGLAAVQWLPSATTIGDSTRASYDAPRNIYEFARSPFEPVSRPSFRQTLLGQVQAGHHSQIFDFSVGPWRFIELLWPNISGAMFPRNRRWMNAIPAEGPVWTPTLYLGLLPVLLASLLFRLRGGDVKRRFLSWCVLFSALAGLGAYGLGWLLAEIHYACGGDGELVIGGPFGGLYWFLTVVLPGYVYFRYPAKLWVITSLAISQLAGMSMDHVLRSKAGVKAARRLKGRLSLVLLGSLAVSALLWLVPIDGSNWLKNAPVDRPFGPLEISEVWPQLMAALLHTCLLAAIFLAVLCHGGRQQIRTTRKCHRQGWLLAMLTAVELVVAQHQLIALAPPDAMTERRFPDINRPTVPVRFFRGLHSWYPNSFDKGSDDRLRQCLEWNNATLFPKHHLLQDLAVVGSRHSMKSARLTALFTAVAGAHSGDSLPVRFLQDLGVSYQIASASLGSGREPPPLEPPPLEPGTWPQVAAIPGHSPAVVRLYFDSEQAPRRAWIVKQLEWVRAVDPRNASTLAAFCRQVVQPAGEMRDFRISAVVEASTAPTGPEIDLLESSQRAPNATASERVDVAEYTDTRIQLDVDLRTPGLVVLNDTYAAGWNAYVMERGRPMRRPIPIYRANCVMRGVYLPAGNFAIEMRYEPRDLYVGALISLCAWIGCLLYVVIHFGLQLVRRLRAHA